MSDDDEPYDPSQDEMTLRDLFVLAMLKNAGTISGAMPSPENLYKDADSLLKARGRQEPPTQRTRVHRPPRDIAIDP